MNTQNMTIENAFLSNNAVAKSLQIAKYAQISKSEANFAEKSFRKTMEKAQIIGQGVSWLESAEGQSALKDHGLKWSAKDLFEHVYGVSKSLGHKYNRASKLDADTIESFIERGTDLGLNNLLSFAKDGGAECVTGDTDGEGEGEGTPSTKPTTILTLAFKGGDLGNVSIRVDDAGKQVVTGSPEALQAMQSLLNKALMDAGKK